jgi:hypothetical protein
MSVIERERILTSPPQPPPPETVRTPKEVTEADVLHRAADLLEEFGHCKGALGSKERGEFCVMGALTEARRDLGVRDGLGMGYTPLADAIGRDVFLHIWNNHPDRTKAEVVAKLREAAERSQ